MGKINRMEGLVPFRTQPWWLIRALADMTVVRGRQVLGGKFSSLDYEIEIETMQNNEDGRK
jgi:hypothetical protein